MKPKLICILGETCSGKDSIVTGAMKKLSDYKLRTICSYADRPIRDGETEGVEHYFISTKEFNKLKAERESDLLAYTHIKKPNDPNAKGYQYMALIDEVEKAQLYVIDYDGLKNLKERWGDTIDIVTVYIQAPFKERMARAEATRNDFQTEFKKRVEAEEIQFKLLRDSKYYDYKINNANGKLENSINRLCVIIEYELIKNGYLPKKTNS